MGPPRHLPVAADALPRVARIVRSEEPAAVGRLAIGSWDAVTRLDLGVDAVRHRLADSEADLTDCLGGKTAGELLPRRATVRGFPDSAASTAAETARRVNLDLPESRVQNQRV